MRIKNKYSHPQYALFPFLASFFSTALITLYCRPLAEGLAHCRYSMNVCWKKNWINIMHKISIMGPLGSEDTFIKTSSVSHWESAGQFSWNNSSLCRTVLCIERCLILLVPVHCIPIVTPIPNMPIREMHPSLPHSSWSPWLVLLVRNMVLFLHPTLFFLSWSNNQYYTCYELWLQ